MFNSTLGTLLISFIFLLMFSQTSPAQTTAFTYQGKLSDNGNPASGQFDFQFKLFDTQTVGTGTQQGSNVAVSNITVTAGLFTVQLDFGVCSSCFDGAARFLEIAVKPTSSGTFTTLGPRQPLTSTPYAIKTLNLTMNGPYDNGMGTSFTASNTFAGAGAGANTTPNPNVSVGSGKVNSFFGAGAGQANILGAQNAFFGTAAGMNATGSGNAFFGYSAGIHSTTAFSNAFFGTSAGFQNTDGDDNAFFGSSAGFQNTTGGNNSFFGTAAGLDNTTGIFNAFIGYGAGTNSLTGQNNTFIGTLSGFPEQNATGDNNTLLGHFAKVNSGVNNSTAIGTRALVSQSNSLVLGGIAGVNGGTNTNVGIGTTAPAAKLDIQGGNVAINNNLLQLRGAADPNHGLLYSATVDGPEFRAFGGFRWTNGTAGASERMRMDASGNLGIGTTTPAFKLDVNGELRANVIRIDNYVNGGTVQVCVETITNRLAVCNSSLRYKTAVQPFKGGLTIINRLQPIRYNWKQSGLADIGLAAEAVEQVEPLLTFRNGKGEVEGVKYNQMAAVFVNAIKEQQAQIEAQQKEIAALKKVVCLDHPEAEMCKP